MHAGLPGTEGRGVRQHAAPPGTPVMLDWWQLCIADSL